ncbi:replication-associated protein [Pacific flying fox faeces associated circular DNA virus-4]|uniref:Replication-associated protein n=1 Tax=Pacific flying fox faeces associated circular DNA virus-4 TaxID=1796013 RepID=A0A140CTT3_9VIRU|nr:replication-associated protein [Pacific flying fox faeces associated circular DNA virus-4]
MGSQLTQRSRNFCFTLNNYTESDTEAVKAIDCKYMVVGFEVGEKGTPHHQGYIRFENARSLGATIKQLPGKPHVEVAKGNASQNIAYCTKSGVFFEKGTRPIDSETCGRNEKRRWTDARAAAKEGRFDDIPDDIYMRHVHAIKRIRMEDGPKPTDLEPRDTYGLWIYGPPGTGKSHFVRTNFRDHYIKGANKWWTGYCGQKYVVIDELSPASGPELSQYMKKWADRWSFEAETKGGNSIIRPYMIIVTSNYSIEEVFSRVDAQAIKRRFTEIKFQ